MKAFIIGLIVLILIVIGFVFLDTSDPATSDTDTPTREATRGTDDRRTGTHPDKSEDDFALRSPSGYRVHVEPAFGYALSVPFEVDVSSPQSGITRYRYVGPENEPDTEITDGYTLTISAVRARATSAMGVALSNLQGNRETAHEGPTSVTIAGEATVRYVVESEPGGTPVTKYTFLPGNGYEYTASVNISPSEDSSYAAEVDTILGSLQFFDDDAAAALRSRVVPIAMLDYGAVGGQYVRESEGPVRGCDSVVFVDHVLPEPTISPLTAALQQLFAYEEETVGGWQNFIASQTDTLSFERVTITDGTAEVYLKGELGPLGGVCDNPRAAIQIEETALAFDSVSAVTLFLNGEETTLTPSSQ